MKKVSLACVAFFFVFMTAIPVRAADRLVPSSYTTIQSAINAAAYGDVVKVATGTYPENIVMKEGVSLQGGYSADFSIRDISLYVTVIDGGKNGSVVRFESITSGSIDGFTITNGEADFGGGINCVVASPSILNNTIKGNRATIDGGGIRCFLSSPTIADNTIAANEANLGGGILCYESDPQIIRNTITDNKAGADGGGIECYEQSNAVISGNTITGNEAGAQGGGILLYGSSPQISMNAITKNKAGGDGGGIECYIQANPMISYNTISANKAGDDGGAIYCYESSPQISNNTITYNKSDDNGGGIVLYAQSNPIVSNNIISGNEAGDDGGGIYCNASSPRISNVILSGNHAFSYGGAIFCSSSSAVVLNCTVVRNNSAEDSAVYMTRTSFSQIANTIFWQNRTDLIVDFTSSPGVTYSEISDARFSGQNGNISADPLFADIEAGDYRLSSGSPCIDAGDPSADQKDPDGSRNNMGAFGGPGAAAWATDIPKIPVPYKEESHWYDLGLYGGQISCLAIDPADSSRIFAVSWMGDGLFVTGNGGAAWQTVEGFRNNDTYWVGIDPRNRSRVWVVYNHFVALSVDGGTLWSKWRLPENRMAYSGAIDPTHSSIAYVGAGGTDGSSQNGTIFKTEDGGRTWTQSYLPADRCVTFLAINPLNHQEIWAATGYNDTGSVYKSIDGGKVLEKVDIGYTDNSIYKIIIHPERPSTVYISGDFGVIRTSDGGKAWEDVGITDACNGLAMDPGNANILYASTHYGSGNYIYKSLDGGDTWFSYPIGFNGFRCLAVDPQNSSIVYGGDLNLGVFKSHDMGATWGAINQGIRAGIIRDSAVDPNDSDILLSSTQAGLFKRERDGEWNRLSFETAYCVTYDPQDSNTIYVGEGWSLAKTTDAGKTWEKIDISSSSAVHRVSSIAIHPQNRNVVFVGVYYYSGNRGEIYRSSDGGNTFNLIKVFDRPVNVVKIDPSNPQAVYAGTGMFYVSSYDQPGGVYKSVDGGATWSTPLLDDVVVNSISIDPVDANVLYVGCGQSGDEYYGLFKSVDGGLIWESMDFDPSTVTEVKINLGGNRILYAATYRRGVYTSVDRGENWTNIGLSDYRMLDLSFSRKGAASALGHSFGQTECVRSLYAGTNSGISAFTGSCISGWIFDSSGTGNIYPAQVWLEVGQLRYHADVFDSGAYLILYPPVGQDYEIFCTADGYSQGHGSGIDVGAMSDISYDFHLSPSAVPDAPTLTVTTSGTSVTISWTRVSAAAGYRLYYAPFPYAGPDTIGCVDMGTQTGLSVGLWKGASFYVAATAYNSAGSSGYSNIAHFVVQ